MITEKQKDNIYNLSFKDQLEILDICLEALGAVDVQQATKILGLNRSRIYQLMDSCSFVKIGSHKFPCINIIIKK